MRNKDDKYNKIQNKESKGQKQIAVESPGMKHT